MDEIEESGFKLIVEGGQWVFIDKDEFVLMKEDVAKARGIYGTERWDDGRYYMGLPMEVSIIMRREEIPRKNRRPKIVKLPVLVVLNKETGKCEKRVINGNPIEEQKSL